MINKPKSYCFEIDCSVYILCRYCWNYGMNISVENNMLHHLCQGPTHAFPILFPILHIKYNKRLELKNHAILDYSISKVKLSFNPNYMWILIFENDDAKLLECSFRTMVSLSCSEQTFVADFLKGMLFLSPFRAHYFNLIHINKIVFVFPAIKCVILSICS